MVCAWRTPAKDGRGSQAARCDPVSTHPHPGLGGDQHGQAGGATHGPLPVSGETRLQEGLRGPNTVLRTSTVTDPGVDWARVYTGGPRPGS